MSRRKLCYITGARADFGLMQSTLQQIQQSGMLDLRVIVTGMHLLRDYGLTVTEIERAGLPIAARIAVEEGVPTGALMARNIGRMLVGFVEALEAMRPDMVLVLGDRGEMLAGALAAIHLNIPVVHIHGGERSGTVDEPVRHAISKLAHSISSRPTKAGTGSSAWARRRTGYSWSVLRVSMACKEAALAGREALCAGVGFDPKRPVALLVYHPVLQEADRSGQDTAIIIDAVLSAGHADYRVEAKFRRWQQRRSRSSRRACRSRRALLGDASGTVRICVLACGL